MRKSIKTIGIVATMGIMLVCAYLLGTTQAKTITEVQTAAEIKEIEKPVEVVPDGYIPLDECIPLEDVACYYFINGYGYPCFELKDIGNQLDNPNNRSYADIMESLDNTTDEYRNNFVDMRQVTEFEATENGLQLYFEDGSGYYWER